MKRRGFLATLLGLPAVAKKLPAMLAAGSTPVFTQSLTPETRIVKLTSIPGCTLTTAIIRGLEPWEFDQLAMKEVELAKKFPNPKGLEDLLRSK